MARHRAWTFTVNNFTKESESHLDELDVKYLLYGREKGESGTPHLQGYVVWDTNISFKQCKNRLPDGTHIEVARGNSQQNYDYCTKDGDFYEKGDRPRAGKRKDLEEIYELAKEQRSDIEIGEACPATYMKYYKACDRVRLNYARLNKRSGPIKVTEITEGSYEDKLEAAYAIDPDLYWFQGQWWDGYSGQKTILITDSGLRKATYEVPHNYQLPIKGGFTWKEWTHVIIVFEKRYATKVEKPCLNDTVVLH